MPHSLAGLRICFDGLTLLHRKGMDGDSSHPEDVHHRARMDQNG